ncbi:MAG: c-type cytochrome [Thermoanaerobaculia bacterium]
MRRPGRLAFALAVATFVSILAVLCILTMRRGFSAREEPSSIEKLIARQARHLAVPRAARELRNPLSVTPELLAEARAHFADHCALCHGNDGRGKTEIGQSLYPKAPDMTLEDTQNLADGELFYIIKNGIRLTGMPAWGGDNPADDHSSWQLVYLIRHFPHMTGAEMREMEAFNPVSPAEMREKMEEEQFLEGDEEPPAETTDRHKH